MGLQEKIKGKKVQKKELPRVGKVSPLTQAGYLTPRKGGSQGKIRGHLPR